MQTQQSRTFEIFLALCEARPIWAGRLLLGIGLNEAGRALSLASLAVGAAGLFLEQDPAELRLAQREGCCTFSVTTLEEAIRALKNEVRQGRGVTIALSGNASVWLGETVARGLQPQAAGFTREREPCETAHAATLERRGASVLHGLGLVAWPGGQDLDAGLRRSKGDEWEIKTDSAPTLANRRERDKALLVAIGETAGPMRDAASRWLRVAPSLFPRALDREYLHLKSRP